jgi:hypothetical protein
METMKQNIYLLNMNLFQKIHIMLFVNIVQTWHKLLNQQKSNYLLNLIVLHYYRTILK